MTARSVQIVVELVVTSGGDPAEIARRVEGELLAADLPDVVQIIDVRPWRSSIAAPGGVAELVAGRTAPARVERRGRLP